MNRLRACAYSGLLALLPATGLTADRWEASNLGNDDSYYTRNELVHGSVQHGHDLEPDPPGVTDRDWMSLRTRARHSYEARVTSGFWTIPSGCSGSCATFNRVDSVGAILTAGVKDGVTSNLYPSTLGVRWIAPVSANEYLVAAGQVDYSALDTYDVDLYDTTYFMPRFNNSGTQVTVLVIQNTRDALVTGEIYFYNGAGTLLSAQPLSIPAQGVQVLNSATIPELLGQSGSVTIAQLGGYGALAGKGVALEPSTGFTFDTAFAPLPR